MSAPEPTNMYQKPGYEKRDVNIRSTITIAAAIVAFVAVSLVVLNEYFLVEKEQLIFDAVLKPESISLKELRASEDEILHSYKLIDSAKGVYRVPIDRAMELVAEEAYQSSRQ